MTSKQKAKTNMYLGLLLFLNGTMNIWQVLAIFQTVFDKFKAKLSALQVVQALQESLITGYAMQKRTARIAMADVAFRIKSALQSYASETGNEVLFMAVNWSFTDLIEGASVVSKNRCQVIYNEALAIIANLGPYSIVQADLDDLLLKINTYNTIISNPKNVIVKRKNATKEISVLIKAIDAILKKNMDKLVGNWKVSAPEFYRTYFYERKIYDPKTSFTEVIAVFKNKATGNEVEGVIFKGTGDKGAEFEILSNTNGVADKKQISPEIYNFSWEIPGFQSGNMNQVKVSPGEKEKLEIELIPVN